ncbi:hypothetical protein GCM10020358_12360 [Amorphoplanes nipponensis]|uniref:Uncharacterized protein n=1 Tax=Actinoplanes nipponensis TaxID=135950 RepID=A0A919JKC2_9ACTN|nr:hypothetical protein [Actinoplanes nipponensis]GIE50727.1 hypothetical protein Ani05nite_42610 [Actinoplanes nipponensis]
MDVPDLLRQAAGELPAGLPRADLDECLAQREWALALDVLLDRGDDYPATTSFFQHLEEAAHRLGLERSAAWCAWRRREVLHGVIRAELRLLPGARREPVPGAGRVRPLWDIGLVTPAGAPDPAVALIWVEFAEDLPPGGAGPVRLAPLTAARWHHLTPGDRITMHERQRLVGVATITEAVFPGPPRRR